MDIEAFIAWCLAPARTEEERYTVELLVEHGGKIWDLQHGIYEGHTIDDTIARERERTLNPAYKPTYSEAELRKAAPVLVTMKQWFAPCNQPFRSLAPFRFCTALENLNLNGADPADLAPLADLPALHTLALVVPVPRGVKVPCEDFTPLARCQGLRHLSLSFGVQWPNLTGLDSLPLESLSLSGNLLALPPGLVFPGVIHGMLTCKPLAARTLDALPRLPACQFLTLDGVERLDDIEVMPNLRNLHIRGRFQTLEPLTALRELTCLTIVPEVGYSGHGGSPPREISPLARLPKLQFLRISPPSTMLDSPRDYSPLTEAPALRELSVSGCPPVDMEVAAIQAGLLRWDDVFLRPEPRPLPPLRFILADHRIHPRAPNVRLEPDESAPADTGLRECEGKWVGRYAVACISRKVGYEEWGTATASGLSRWLHVNIESFDVVDRVAEIVDTVRAVLASLQGEYQAQLMITLLAKPPEATPAQKELEAQFRQQQDDWEYEQRRRDQEEYQERLHQMELKKQEGKPIEPAEFSPDEAPQPPAPPWKSPEHSDESNDAKSEIDFTSRDEDEDDGEGGTAVKQLPDPPPSFLDDEHPLAGNYSLMACITLGEFWASPHRRGLAEHLLGREVDEEIPGE